MKVMRYAAPLFGLLLLAGGCASTGSGSGLANQEALTTIDLVEFTDRTAFDAVRQLRPIWLNDRRGGTSGLATMAAEVDPSQTTSDIQSERGIKVYVNGVQARDGVDELRGIRADQVQEMRKLDAQDASMRFGVGHSSGAILVTLKNG